jgi:hypothetical protein
MKRLLTYLFIDVLIDFKCFRRKQGGTWYLVADSISVSGFAGPVAYWTRVAPVGDLELVEKENYSDS